MIIKIKSCKFSDRTEDCLNKIISKVKKYCLNTQ
jgi:hypothetical protein